MRRGRFSLGITCAAVYFFALNNLCLVLGLTTFTLSISKTMMLVSMQMCIDPYNLVIYPIKTKKGDGSRLKVSEWWV
jgi:hypothetical protein